MIKIIPLMLVLCSCAPTPTDTERTECVSKGGKLIKSNPGFACIEVIKLEAKK